MIEHRKLKRWHVIYYLRIFDQDTGSLLGHLVDVTTEGMKMVSERAIPVHEDWRLKMDVPLEGETGQEVLFQARSMWSGKDTNPDFYATGFQIANPEPGTIQVIQSMIDGLSFDD